MGDKAHKAELFCRKLVAEYPHSIEKANFFRNDRERYGDDWPEWCDLPMAATYAIITNAVSNPEVQMMEDGPQKLPELTAALIWMRYKTVFAFNGELSEALQGQPLDGDIPVQALECLPYPCVFVERKDKTGFFAWLEWDVNLKMKELRLLMISEKDSMPISVPLVGTLQDSVNAPVTSGLVRSKGASSIVSSGTNDVHKYYESEIAGCINHLLYLCSDEPDMPDHSDLKSVGHTT